MTTTPANSNSTIRELGGEIWAEAFERFDDEGRDWLMRSGIIDLAMRVLARHAGEVLTNDADYPVEPLLKVRPGSQTE